MVKSSRNMWGYSHCYYDHYWSAMIRAQNRKTHHEFPDLTYPPIGGRWFIPRKTVIPLRMKER